MLASVQFNVLKRTKVRIVRVPNGVKSELPSYFRSSNNTFTHIFLEVDFVDLSVGLATSVEESASRVCRIRNKCERFESACESRGVVFINNGHRVIAFATGRLLVGVSKVVDLSDLARLLSL